METILYSFVRWTTRPLLTYTPLVTGEQRRRDYEWQQTAVRDPDQFRFGVCYPRETDGARQCLQPMHDSPYALRFCDALFGSVVCTLVFPCGFVYLNLALYCLSVCLCSGATATIVTKTSRDMQRARSKPLGKSRIIGCVL